MAKEQEELVEEHGLDFEEMKDKTEEFVESNKITLSIIVLAVVLIIGGYFVYSKVYVANLDEEAAEQMFVAEQYFERDSFNLAINGDGNYLGFLDIIDEYGITKCANLAHYYTGVSYLRLGNYDEAIEYLSGFDSDDYMIAPIAVGCIGDAYIELGNPDKAIQNYVKAAEHDNTLTSPIYLKKAALAYEELGNYNGALDMYKKISKEYPASNEAQTIKKYITRTEMKLTK